MHSQFMNFLPRLLLCFVLLASGCQLLSKKKFDLANYTPPNCKNVGPGLYLDETEIANIHWLEFLFFARQDSVSNADFQLLLPDTSVWECFPKDSIFVLDTNCQIEKNTFYDPFGGSKNNVAYRAHYFRYPGFRYYPVVGLSQVQAKIYAIWRSEMVNENMTAKLSNKKLPYRIIYQFRLPYASELDSALVQNPIGLNSRKNWDNTCQGYRHAFPYEKYLNANVLRKGILRDTSLTSPQSPFFDQVFAYKGAMHGLIGNASELTAEPFTSWGGSCFDIVEKEQFQNRTPHFKPDHKTGFRCICQVSVVAASTYKPEKWHHKPEVKQLFELARRSKLEAYSMKTNADFNRYAAHYNQIFKGCTVMANPVLFKGKRFEHGNPIVFEDSIVNNPVFFQIPGFEQTGRLEVDLKGNRLNTWYLKADSLKNFTVPDGTLLESGDAIILMDKFPNAKGCQWFWIPYQLKNDQNR